VTLVDLSRPMLDRAITRIRPLTSGSVTALRGDIREIPLGEGTFDIIVAAAVFHHLRSEQEWRNVFTKCFNALKNGGSLWIADLVRHTMDPVHSLMWSRYGDYLTGVKDAAYRDGVFAYIEKEDTPQSLLFQLDLLNEVGFRNPEVLHKNSCFAAFGAMR